MRTLKSRLDLLRHETLVVLHITERDRVKRIAATVMILALCWYAGFRLPVLAIAIAITATEIVAYLCHRRVPPPGMEPPDVLVITIWLTNSVSVFFYLAPAILLAGQPSVPLLLAGFVWVFGVFVHITNTFVALPISNWSQMVPGFLSVVLILWRAASHDHQAEHPLEWVIVAGTIVVYASNTLQTLMMQKDTQRALTSARADATARLRALEHMTRHDALTGLLTRRAFDEQVTRMIERQRPPGRVAILMIDLDGFKPVNDTYTHEAGDAVLAAVGRRLRDLAGRDGIATRLGGDEFGLALPGNITEGEVRQRAAEVLSRISEPVNWSEVVLRIGASIGIALVPESGGTVARALSEADQACNRAKSKGKGRIKLFDPSLFAPPVTLRDRERLLSAIEAGHIRPHYQPQIDLASGALVGFEALARWDHPERGLIAAAEFMDQIDQCGLQAHFLNGIAARVLDDIDSLLAEGFDPGRIALNLPEDTLATKTGRRDLAHLLATRPALRDRLTLEITENVFIGRAGGEVQTAIAELRADGLRLALDDFGTGYASLHHLRTLDFDELKIHADFVAGLGRDHRAEVLIEGLLGIARGLGVPVVAEGIETEAHALRLLRMGCQIGQGYHFSPALSLDEVRSLLSRPEPRLTRAGA